MTEPPLRITVEPDHIGTIELSRPPNNFFSFEMIAGVADALDAFDADPAVRVAVLCSEGKHFCAGADFSPGGRSYAAEDLYAQAARIFHAETPIVAAIQGAAIGGGLGLALAADFRIAAPEARLSANFARLGFHPGFGLSVTLPRLVGPQAAAELLFTGRRVPGAEAAEIGLVDRLVDPDELTMRTHAFAVEIATSAPLAVRSIRRTLRGDLAARVVAAMEHEAAEQATLRATEDFEEGTAAMRDRRPPVFRGR